MKKLSFFAVLALLFTVNARAQTMANWEAKNQGTKFYVETKMTRSCGDYSDLSFVVTNNTSGSLDIKLFVEKKDGRWQSLGSVHDLGSRSNVGGKDVFWSCGNTGAWIIYYRAAGSTDQFPSEQYVNQKFGRKSY